MTLSLWFRDYLYIPLGGNRKGEVRTAINIMIVFALTGLWHGASWNFIAWGLLNGALIVLERFLHIEKLPKPFGHIYFLFAVVTGWIIFRSENLNFALSFLKTIYSFDFANSAGAIYYLNNELIFTLIIAFLFSIPLVKKVEKYIPLFIQNTVYCVLLVISSAYIAVNTYQPFIYFRF